MFSPLLFTHLQGISTNALKAAVFVVPSQQIKPLLGKVSISAVFPPPTPLAAVGAPADLHMRDFLRILPFFVITRYSL